MLSDTGSYRSRQTGTRRGLTLAELLVTVVLLSIVSAGIVTFMLRQSRFYRSTDQLMQTRGQIRQAAGVLPNDLRGISSADNDIYAMTDTSLEFRAVFGASVVCANQGGKTPYITIPPTKLAKQSVLTSWVQKPVVGDSLAVYVEGATTAANDDSWSVHEITTITGVTGDLSTGCASSTKLTQASDLVAGNPSYKISLSPTQATTVNTGAAIRFFRKVHYSLYKDTDLQWYLGFYDCLPGRTPVCATIQPVAGPFPAYSGASPGTSGLQFLYYDSTGTITSVRNQVTRISFVIRAVGNSTIQLAGGSPTTFADSLRVEVALRNWK
jgi:prepilin-type N-terminal cleavage/methylation domain-containing protein